MSSSWVEKLEKRLTALANGSSKESIQTLAKWIGFNRKHSVAFCDAFKKALEDETRQLVLYQVIHEVMLLEKDSSKWEKLHDLRMALGESVVIPEIEKSVNDILLDQLKPLVDQWDDANIFGSPMLIQRLQSLLKNPKKATVGDDVLSSSEEQHEVPADVPRNKVVTEGAPLIVVIEAKVEVEPNVHQIEDKQIESILEIDSRPKLEIKDDSLRSVGEQDYITFDFEAEGVPQEKVEAKEFLEPCKALATFQIARDLRADTAAHLSSVLAAVSDDTKQSYRELNSEDIPQELIDSLSVQLTDNVLDIDLDDALQNVETFRELVQKQHAARQRLIYLLLKSRCKFGSHEAAEAFYGLDAIQEKLQQRKELLTDAMELEGIDIEEDKPGDEQVLDNLAPLSWYETNDSDPDAKRVKLGE